MQARKQIIAGAGRDGLLVYAGSLRSQFHVSTGDHRSRIIDHPAAQRSSNLRHCGNSAKEMDSKNCAAGANGKGAQHSIESMRLDSYSQKKMS